MCVVSSIAKKEKKKGRQQQRVGSPFARVSGQVGTRAGDIGVGPECAIAVDVGLGGVSVDGLRARWCVGMYDMEAEGRGWA